MAITGGAFTLIGHPTAPLTSHPHPHPQVGVRPDPSRAVPPPQDKGPLASHQCVRHDSLQRVCMQTSSLPSRHGPTVPSPLAPGPGGVDGDSSTDSRRGGWFRDGSSILALLCTLSLSLLHLCHLRPPDLRSRRLGTPGLDHGLGKGMSVHALHHLHGARHAAAVR